MDIPHVRLAEIAAIPDEEIDTSDIPEACGDFFSNTRLVLPRPTGAEIARFMSFVYALPWGCWLWTGARSRSKGNRQHYGSFSWRGRSIRAHVFAHDVLGGRVCPVGWHRDHECRFSLCVNPAHVTARRPEDNQSRVGEHDLFTLAKMATIIT